MKVNNKTFVLALIALMLSACTPVVNQGSNQTAVHPPAAKEHSEAKPVLKGIEFSCSNGLNFTISFEKHSDTAQFLLSGDGAIHILKNRRLGSGIAYGDNKFVYEEHHGKVKLSHPVGKISKITACHKV